MKNLTKPSLRINPTLRSDGTLPAWSRKTKAVEVFVEWALANQNNQCAFCGFIVGNVAERRAWSVEHFAPKGTALYPQWTFEPLNLIITCHVCNSVFKNEYNSVEAKAPSYVNCTFFLVHPYLDSVDDHLVGTYTGGNQEVGVPLAISPKGRKTIEMFFLNDPNYLTAINNQALLISLSEWQNSIPDVDRSLFLNVLAELSGRR